MGSWRGSCASSRDPRIFTDPAPTRSALDLVDVFRDARATRWLAPSPEVWQQFARIVDNDPMVRGNLVPDADQVARVRAKPRGEVFCVRGERAGARTVDISAADRAAVTDAMSDDGNRT
jgi:hypothetical protein